MLAFDAGTPTPNTPGASLSRLQPLLAFLRQPLYGDVEQDWKSAVEVCVHILNATDSFSSCCCVGTPSRTDRMESFHPVPHQYLPTSASPLAPLARRRPSRRDGRRGGCAC